MDELIKELLREHEMDGETKPAGFCSAEQGNLEELLKNLKILLFPRFFREIGDENMLESYLAMVLFRTHFLLEAQLRSAGVGEKSRECCKSFLRQLPRIRQALYLDLQAFEAGDPAAEGPGQIIVSYPGFSAILVYRLANLLHRLGVRGLPRRLSELAHSRTGIDIHPAATIGSRFFIDHGTGVVIGQTAAIGDEVKLYQGVTLGALSTRGGRDLRHQKRHPTIEDHVTVYAGATILGGNTVIGKGATIGANAFITASVAEGAKVK